ncbi:unnamed protein product [Caenorhabditis brenneri]
MSDESGPAPKMPRLDSEGAPKTENILRFDDPDPNTHDVVINVKGTKFYCVKMTLAKHSEHFYDLFFKDPNFVGRTEITLDEPELADAFEMFLNAIHGVNTLNQTAVRYVLRLAKLWKCPVAVQCCLDYIDDKANWFNNEWKFEIALEFNLEDMKKKIISEVKNCDALHNLVPKNVMDLDHATMALIMEKNLALQGLEGRHVPSTRHQDTSRMRPADQLNLEMQRFEEEDRDFHRRLDNLRQRMMN